MSNFDFFSYRDMKIGYDGQYVHLHTSFGVFSIGITPIELHDLCVHLAQAISNNREFKKTENGNSYILDYQFGEFTFGIDSGNLKIDLLFEKQEMENLIKYLKSFCCLK